MELPYRAEYAKSNRASCRGCKSSIGKDTLRLAVMVQVSVFLALLNVNIFYQMFFYLRYAVVLLKRNILYIFLQSPVFDGRAAHWYHFQCFFTKQKPKSTDDIEHFESLRWDDQQKIKDKIRKIKKLIKTFSIDFLFCNYRK